MLPRSPLTRAAVHLELPVYRWPFGTTDIGIFLSPELTVIIVFFTAKTGLVYEVPGVYPQSYLSFSAFTFILLGAFTSSADKAS